MKILLMTPWMEYFLGAETHFYTLAKELISKGHEVSIFTYLKGPMWKTLRNSGIICLEENPKDEYDLVIMNGNPCVGNAPESAFKIMIINGIVPSEEYPTGGIDRYVAVSEEVSEVLFGKRHKGTLVRNGIDCERFIMMKPAHKRLKNILMVSNKQFPQNPIFKVINEACREMKLNLSVLGLQFGTAQWDVAEFINQNDLVISLGRGVLEAMACERNVLICDYQGLEGMINSKNYFEIRKNNFSGRRFRLPISQEAIVKELKKYDFNQGKKNRKFILDNHDIKKTAENLLQLYKYRDLNI
jgi:hypothetical protein